MKIRRIQLHQAVDFARSTDQGFTVNQTLKNGSVENIDADFERQIVNVKNASHRTIIPFANIKYMLPFDEKARVRSKADPVGDKLVANERLKKEIVAANITVVTKDPLTEPPKP